MNPEKFNEFLRKDQQRITNFNAKTYAKKQIKFLLIISASLITLLMLIIFIAQLVYNKLTNTSIVLFILICTGVLYMMYRIFRKHRE